MREIWWLYLTYSERPTCDTYFWRIFESSRQSTCIFLVPIQKVKVRIQVGGEENKVSASPTVIMVTSAMSIRHIQNDFELLVL